MRRILLALLIATPALATPALAQTGKPEQPSFDCLRARAWDETAICADNALSLLDRRIAAAFVAARAAADPARRDALLAEQRAWLRDRSGCSKPEGQETPPACLARVMTARAGVLEAAAGTAPSPPPVAAAAPPSSGQLARVAPAGGCAAPAGWAERTICADPALLALDQEIARLAAEAANRPARPGQPSPAAVRADYLGRRNACERPVGMMPMDCLDDLMQGARDSLRSALGQRAG